MASEPTYRRDDSQLPPTEGLLAGWGGDVQ